MLRIEGLTRYFYDSVRGQFPAVDNLSFEAAAGEVFGLLGPNGAGKTTTLRMVAQLLKPSSGTISIDGTVFDMSPSCRKLLGFLSNSTGLYERLTPREVLVFFARLNGLSGAALTERVAQIVETFEIMSFADVRCEKLSSGMRQRVSVARAIVHDPRLVILDEPTVGLDVIAKQALYEFIADCKKRNKIVVFSTHLMHEAEKCCDRFGILHQGKLFATGNLTQLREMTSQHYLEDIFLSIVKGQLNESK